MTVTYHRKATQKGNELTFSPRTEAEEDEEDRHWARAKNGWEGEGRRAGYGAGEESDSGKGFSARLKLLGL